MSNASLMRRHASEYAMGKVNHPSHYNKHPSNIECIDVVEEMTFNVGSAIKYLWRAGLKDGSPTVEDLEKAKWYVEREIARTIKKESQR